MANKVPIWELPDVPKGELPPHLHLQRTRVFCNSDAPTHTDNIQYSGAYAAMGVDNSLRLDQFRNGFRVEVIRLTEDEMEFDLIGIDAALANAFRRILIAELPTMAIEKEIELEAHAVKGMGKTHAKWSPVATAWYRMLPEIVLLQEVENKKAEELVKKCPVNVFDIEDIGKGKRRATVARPRACTLCRECIRGDEWDKYVAVRRVKDHFIFTIEATGALPPQVLFTEAVKILEDKCERVITELS